MNIMYIKLYIIMLQLHTMILSISISHFLLSRSFFTPTVNTNNVIQPWPKILGIYIKYIFFIYLEFFIYCFLLVTDIIHNSSSSSSSNSELAG